MPRSVGITVSAVVVLIGSAFTILGGAMMVLASVFLSKSSPAANAPVNLGYFVVIEAVILFGFGGWGLVTGIGLINLQPWARISTLVFAAILVFISLPGAVLLAVIPLPNTTNNPNLPSNFMTILRVGMVTFYAMVAALGGFWLYLFNRQHVKAQFQREQPAVESAVPDLHLGTLVAAHSTGHRARPLSITIIGWFLVVSSAATPLFLLFYSTFLPGMQLPLFFLGFFFFGRSASLILIVWMAAQMVAAVGLLKLKNWGLFATIGLQCLAVTNAVLLVGIPANRARFQQLMETMMASMNTRMPQPAPFVVPMWAGIASSLPIVFVILWFLITRKQAFTSAAQEMARHRS
jgi:hypothetical protein